MRLASAQTKNDSARTLYLDNELQEVFECQWRERKERGILTPFIFDVPFTILFGLLSLPLALMAGKKVLSHYDQMAKLIPA